MSLFVYFSPIYTVVLPVSRRCRHGLNPGSTRCNHGVRRPYTVSPRSVKDVPRCRPVLVPVLPGMTTVLPGVPTVLPGVATVLFGLSRSVGTAFGFNLCFASRRCNSNWLVSKCAWNKINLRDYLKL